MLLTGEGEDDMQPSALEWGDVWVAALVLLAFAVRLAQRPGRAGRTEERGGVCWPKYGSEAIGSLRALLGGSFRYLVAVIKRWRNTRGKKCPNRSPRGKRRRRR